MLQAVKSHLPLIAIATISAALVLYLYRELQKAKRELLAVKSEDCTPALSKDAKRVRFQDTQPAGAEETAKPAKQARAPKKAEQAAEPGPREPVAPPVQAGAPQGGGALESAE